MRTEIYNCIQSRGIPAIISNTINPPEEDMMNIYNYTNYDMTYTLIDNIPRKKVIIYPFQWFTVRRLKHNQHALISVLKDDTFNSFINIRIDRPFIKNKLTIFASKHNPYQFAPGTLGIFERLYIKYLLHKGVQIYID